MKKLIALIIVACLIGASVFVISTCEKDEESTISSKVKQKITAYRTDLEDSSATLTSTKAIKSYLCNWAETKGVNYTEDEHDNIIYKVQSSETYKEVSPSVIICPYDPKRFDECIDPIAIAMYLAKNNENTGELSIIFTKESGHNFEGIQALDNKYFPDNANVFCLNSGPKNMWSTASAGRSSYTFTQNITYTEPKGNKAYKISIEGLPGGVPNQKIASYPNPIKELGDLLAYFKTNSLIFDLAKVKGGASDSLYPESASAIIVINENDQEKFEKRMSTAINNFNNDFAEHYPSVTYTYKEVELPEKAFTATDMNRFISLLYTLVDGVFERNEEDDIVSITTIGSVRVKDNQYKISASGYSMTAKDMNQIDLSYTTICGLSSAEFEKTLSLAPWKIDNPDDNPFVKQVSDAFYQYSEGKMEYKDSITSTNCTYIYEKNPNCNIMNITVNKARIEKYAGTLVTFLMNQIETLEE